MTPKKALKFIRRIAQDASGCPREIHVEYREAVKVLEETIEQWRAMKRAAKNQAVLWKEQG